MKLSHESSILIADDEDVWAANKENQESTKNTRAEKLYFTLSSAIVNN